HRVPAENDRDILSLIQIQVRVPPRLSSINLVRWIKSSTVSCSARLSSKGREETAPAKFKFFNALRNVFRRLLKPCFTTCAKSFSSHPRFFRSFLTRRI